MEELGDRFGFDPEERRLRCMGHIINLVAREALFGEDVDVFEVETAARQDLVDQLAIWRRKGPIGRLHNLVTWIYQSPQRRTRFHDAQRACWTELNLKKDLNGNPVTLDLVQDNGTRWNSTWMMINRATELRAAIEHYIDAEIMRCKRLEREGNLKKEPGGIAALLFKDRLSTDDWAVLTQYQDILKPMELATKGLEGRPEAGQHGLLFKVIPAFKYLLNRLEQAKTKYDQLKEDYFRINIQLAWQKADDYYSKIDKTPAYLAANVLHPQYKWQYIDKL